MVSVLSVCNQCGQIFGGGRIKWGKRSSYKWNYSELACPITRLCDGQLPHVCSSSAPGGLWSKVLLAMTRPDNRNMRCKLQTMWKENRGNIRVRYSVDCTRFCSDVGNLNLAHVYSSVSLSSYTYTCLLIPTMGLS